MLPVFVCAVVVFVIGESASADLFDDFSGEQTGSWAPARWWDDYARRGRFVVPGNHSPKLDVALSRAQRASEIIAAGGFVVEVDILEMRGSAAGICIASADYQKQGIAVIVQADNKTEADKLYINAQSLEIASDYKIGQTVRIEIDTRDFERGSNALISVYFGKEQVVRDQRFTWKKSPVGFHLSAIGGRGVFDNLLIRTAQPKIEFAGWRYSDKSSNPAIDVKVRLKNARPNWDYTIDCVVAGGTAVQGTDYLFKNQTLTFEEGQTSKTLELDFIPNKKFEADKTIKLALLNPFGGNAILGADSIFVHTIEGRYPIVQFADQKYNVAETAGSGRVKLELSHKCTEPVTIQYNVIGGTADNGKDYKLKNGRMPFKPGEISRDFKVIVLDDSDGENSIDETVLIQLVNPKNCVIGEKNVTAFGITDNEPGIEFDGGIWMCTYDKHTKIKGRNVLSVNDSGQLEWVCTYGDLLLTQLPQKSVSEVGDVAEYAWLYKGEGQDKGSYVENICERYGSGDLRVALLDSSGNPLSMDKQYSRNEEIFCGYKGYQARLSPHVPTNQRADKWAIRVNPNGDNCRSPVDWGGCWGFAKYFNGHGVPVGRFSPMIITLERTAQDTVAFSVTLNNEKHTYVDKDKSPQAAGMEKMESLYGTGSRHVVVAPGYQPKNIDTMAIYFANQRPFDLITFAKLER
jgi:hypothetical protein